jgi:hypothetical protein
LRGGTSDAGLAVPAFLLQWTTHMQWTDLTAILAPIQFAVVGAAAARLYMPDASRETSMSPCAYNMLKKYVSGSLQQDLFIKEN